jgi:hypothetical protein
MWSIFKRKEFYTAEQVHAEVIAQTLVMIESIKQDMQKLSLPEKAQAEKQLLASLGLHNTKNMQVIRDAEDKIVEHNNIIETNKRVLKIIEEMHIAFGKKAMYLPMNVFTQILDKYHLSVGCLNDYKGTIPETNLQEIVNASEIVNTLAKEEYKKVVKQAPITQANIANLINGDYDFGLPDFTEEGQKVFNALQQQCPTITESLEKWYRIEHIHPHNDKPEYRRFPMIPNKWRRDWDFRTSWNAHYMLIAAPSHEMNSVFEISEKRLTDDPIVFSTVGTGVIIYSMWGEEGDDEVMRKYQELNKFIAENVNLKTITESKETIS